MASNSEDDTISRVLFLSSRVHIYQIPPLSSTKGPQASGWTADPRMHIFTARLRVIECSRHPPNGAPSITTTILLEDPSSGELFAEAPYTATACVQAATDSSRFFAIVVVGEGKKATLGIGFEDRGEALDFGLALRDAGKAMGWNGDAKGAKGGKAKGKEEGKRDWGLKEGEVLTVDIKGLRARREEEGSEGKDPQWTAPEGGGLVPPPPPPGLGDESEGGLLAPPPSAREVRHQRRRSREIEGDQKAREEKEKLEALGFDDGEFGEFV
jgi:adaptin ear-binding coat-associated protein 1/2